MAKSSKADNNKVTFGKRRTGKYKKSVGPKEKPTKPNRGQG
jgi:hypothetical protein